MATLTRWEPVRWDPFREMANMRNIVDRFFEETVGPNRTWQGENAMWNLALDVAEKDENFVVKASIPGIDPNDLEISLANDVLTIKGETKADNEIKEESYHVRERRFGSFMRSVSLPVPVNSDKVEANYDNGVLTLTLPKSEAVRPKRITIKADGHDGAPKTIEATSKK